MLLNIFYLFVNFLTYATCWQFNPYCLLNECEKETTDTVKKETSSPVFSKYSLYCSLFPCENEENDHQAEDNTWNPSCWFKECPDNTKQNEQINKNYWSYDYWFNTEDSRTLKNKIECIFKDCPEPEGLQKEKVEKDRIPYFRQMFKSTIDYLNAAKPQEVLINNIFTSELNPLCWLTECCNENTLPGNIEKLSELIRSRLYGQHLVDTIIDAVGSHWNTKHQPRKALVLSFHGPVGTGKNYVTEMIANSLFKLGVKSKYVHFFSGRIHFTLPDNSDSYKQNLYSWLKGNVTECSKQMFIFDEADHMPERVLNSILPMMDYRGKVDGADYRNSIFVFLSNAGSELILTKLDKLYQENRTRTDIVIGDFERDIVLGIFNQKGGFYHSDTITHNLIDHYIPFLPLEEQHVEKCIKDQFTQRNVLEPSDEDVSDVLNSISWGKVSKMKFAKTGCKTVGSKVAYLCEKYYKQPEKEKVDL